MENPKVDLDEALTLFRPTWQPRGEMFQVLKYVWGNRAVGDCVARKKKMSKEKAYVFLRADGEAHRRMISIFQQRIHNLIKREQASILAVNVEFLMRPINNDHIVKQLLDEKF